MKLLENLRVHSTVDAVALPDVTQQSVSPSAAAVAHNSWLSGSSVLFFYSTDEPEGHGIKGVLEAWERGFR